jgi:hypothetical protein
MTKINVLKECGCFRESDFVNNEEFSSKDEALLKAQHMVNYMNDEFCGKHNFMLREVGNELQIAVDMKEARSGGCCGGGHCS